MSVLLNGGFPIEAATLGKLFVFAEADRARIEGTILDAPPEPLEVRGKIVHTVSGQLLWSGPLFISEKAAFSAIVKNVNPLLWSPADPNLYFLHVEAVANGKIVVKGKARFGFRSMEIKNGQLQLNGRPVFLRGVAINPPGRTIPESVAESRAFAEAYVRCLKTHNINIFRISTDLSQTWFDVCDELGMLLYAGRYGSPPGAEEGKKAAPLNFPETINNYRSLFENYVNHPSIVMYYLSNELPVSGKRGEEFSRLLTEAHAALRQWDPTRPYIGNAGYGEGREGDVCDVHRYWGWYYNSFLTYYNLRDKLFPKPLFGDPAKNQPLTFTECVGSFTGSSGEFNVVRSKQLGPRLGWIGHTEHPRGDALDYQRFMVKEATESFRRMRPLNPRLAGIMPFTILFYNWSGITNFDQMQPKPALAQMAVSYQPILLSWENWTPQRYAGAVVDTVAHVVNDSESGTPLKDATLWWGLRDSMGRLIQHGRSTLPDIQYFHTVSQKVRVKTSARLTEADYTLCGSVQQQNQVLSTNWTKLFIASSENRPKAGKRDSKVAIYDPSGLTRRALKKTADLSLQPIDLNQQLPNPKAVPAIIIGEDAWDASLDIKTADLLRYAETGGRVLILKQDPARFNTSWLPSRIAFLEGSPNDADYPPKTRPHREQMCVNPLRPAHPVFTGLDRKRLRLWSDYTGWNQTKPGFPEVYPVTAGFRLLDMADLAHTAVLADYDRGLEGVALVEMFSGKGSIILSGFSLSRRVQIDPAADRLLRNLAQFAASKTGHDPLPLIERTVRWGDFPSEQGVMSGSLNGFLVNTEWIPAPGGPKTEPLPPNTGAWNMMPGDQFVPRGRIPFGPYSYTTGSSLRSTDMEKPGTATFWARVPNSRIRMTTQARNPGRGPAELQVEIEGASTQRGRITLQPGECQSLTVPVPPNSRALRVSYSGPRDLVIDETRFE